MGFPTFGFDRSDKLTYGRIVVSLPPDKDRQFGSITPDFRVLSASLVNDEDDFATALRSEAVQRSSQARIRQGLVFVHGYNESFDRVVFRTAQMVQGSYWDRVIRLGDLLLNADQSFENDSMRLKMVPVADERTGLAADPNTARNWSKFMRAPLSYYTLFGSYA
jgi:Alpha/beta hydrolase of unknown function (DUF900)